MDNKEFEAKLVKDFPLLYADMYGDPAKTCLSHGLYIRPGWFDLVYELSSNINSLVSQFPKEIMATYKVSQVKEKLGGLRFHMDEWTPEMMILIRKAESDSYHICETCGQPGKLVVASYLYTSCKEHAKPQHQKQFEEK